MKNINVMFTEAEYKELLEKKKDLPWYDFILTSAGCKERDNINREE